MEARTASREATREVLVFVLGGAEYGVDILKVQEIRGYDKVTPFPAAPDFLKGMVNIRGIIVPVIDLRVKFGIDASILPTTVMIVLRIGRRMVGVVVDGVSDTLALAAAEVKPAPAMGSVVDASYLSGLATREERMILLLDIEHLLSSGEMNLLVDAARAARES